MTDQGLTPARLPEHHSIKSSDGPAPRAYHLIVEVAADADVNKGLRRIRSAAQFGLRVIEARPFRGQGRQLTQTAVKRQEGRPKLSPDEDADVFRHRAFRGFSF